VTTKKQQEAEAAAAAELEKAKNDLAADGTPAADAAAAANAGAPPAGPDDGGLTPPITKEPAANPRDRTATRARRARRVTEVAPDKATEEELRAEAAAVLRCHVDEVILVEDGDGEDWPVATTHDGQRYQLTGTEPGDYVWLPQRPTTVPQLLGR